LIVTIVAIAAGAVVSGCSGQPLSTREKGTLVGGVLGAGTGAIIGAAVGAPGAGAAIGGGLGAVTGAVVGNEFQNQEIRESQTRGQLEHQQREIEAQHRELSRLRTERESTSETPHRHHRRRHHRVVVHTEESPTE